MLTIKCSAIKFQIRGSEYFHIMCGKRHPDIFALIYDLGIDYDKLTSEQGFMTSDGHFVDRKTAYKIAEAANQIKRDNGCSLKILFSEDIYQAIYKKHHLYQEDLL